LGREKKEKGGTSPEWLLPILRVSGINVRRGTSVKNRVAKGGGGEALLKETCEFMRMQGRPKIARRDKEFPLYWVQLKPFEERRGEKGVAHANPV